MKKPCLLIIIFALIFMQFKVSKIFAQESSAGHNYTLSVGKPIKIKRDTFVYKLMPNGFNPKQMKQDYTVIPVTFTNNSNDTLRYIGMSCSWWDIYRTDNAQIIIAQPDVKCFKNGPFEIKIAPKASSVVELTILLAKTLVKGTDFRIGMIVQPYDAKGLAYFNKFQTNNLIWSNVIQVP